MANEKKQQQTSAATSLQSASSPPADGGQRVLIRVQDSDGGGSGVGDSANENLNSQAPAEPVKEESCCTCSCFTSRDESVQNRSKKSKKCFTRVEGMDKQFHYENILKDLKKQLHCHGEIIKDSSGNKVIQLQGNWPAETKDFLIRAGLAKDEWIKVA